MPERAVTVAGRAGLHARPAARFVKAAAAQPVPVTVRKPGRAAAVDARSILAVLALGVEQGDQVVLSASGDGAETALDALAALLATDVDA